MPAKLKRIHYPKSPEELVELLAGGEGRIAPVGGGVSFSFAVPPGVEELASMRGLGLCHIERREDGLHVGAMVTIASLAGSQEARGFRDGMLCEAASVVAATPNRNLITIGGNSCRLFIWSDLPVALSASNAAFKARGARGARTLSCDEFYAAQPLSVLDRSEFLEEIVVPEAPGRSGASYVKFFETHNQFGLVSAAACVSIDGAERCLSARLCLGGLQLLPEVSAEAAAVLEGKVPSPELVREAAGAAVASAKLVRDIRVSDEYKRVIACATARDALDKAFTRAAAKG